MALLITTLLARYERAEEVSRRTDHNGVQGQVNYKNAHEAMTAARKLIEAHVQGSLSIMCGAERPASDPMVLAATREMAIFTTWMGLRADKRWGDVTNAGGAIAAAILRDPAGKMSAAESPREIPSEGSTVSVLVGMSWEDAQVMNSRNEGTQGAFFYVIGMQQKFMSRDEGVTWRRKS